MLSFSISGSYTDLYQITMAEAHFLEGRQHDPACFDYFFRKIPNEGGYVIFAGLQDVLHVLGDLHFTSEDLHFLRQLNFHDSFIEYLKGFRFTGDVYSCLEGDTVFANAPILRVEGNIIEAQLVEALILNILNFESLVATKASRMKQVAKDSVLSDFGLRRAQGMGSIMATKASIVGGFESTSNVYAAQLYDLTVVGTMAHSFIESYDAEIDAFRAFAKSRPDDCVLLVDTYDTLQTGIPNAIIVSKELEKQGHRARGIRLDSGDLAFLSKAAREMLDAEGLDYMKIVASNQIDEFVIKSLKEQGAPIDIFGVGTKLVTGKPDGALDGVYKLSMASGKPRLKLSESLEKTILPGIKQVLRVFDKNGMFFGADAIILADEGEKADTIFHPLDQKKSLELGNYDQQALLQKVMSNGKCSAGEHSLKEIAAYAQRRLAFLPAEYKRFENPHRYKVGISKKLMELRENLRGQHKNLNR
jgi:nicotinate phosphoribosyltransferase